MSRSTEPDELSFGEYWACIAFGASVALAVTWEIVWNRFVRQYR